MRKGTQAFARLSRRRQRGDTSFLDAGGAQILRGRAEVKRVGMVLLTRHT
ncbi:MAG: hypothetical protein ACKPHU_09080 [Planctomycetaceae bacterium]